MTKKIKKLIVIPVDGSQNALRALDYLDLLLGSGHHLKVVLFYVLPNLPAILVEESKKDSQIFKKLKELENKNIAMAQSLLDVAKKKLLKLGFTQKAVDTVFQQKKAGIARDICNWSEDKRTDAIVISSRGRSRLEVFFTGEVANKVLEFVRVCPVWMVKGTVKNENVLLAVDNSDNALRAVDHCGFMLSGTDTKVTIFHSKRDLRRFIPKEVIEEFPEIKKFWQHKAGEVVSPYMKRAKELLLKAGLKENQISTKMVDGSRSAARDILDEARRNKIGAIVLGKKGYSNVKDYSMGSIAKKVLEQASDMTVCIVP